MGFTYQLPAIVGGTVLVIEQIQSQNYQAGLLGWAIFADGDAEFNNVTVRGTLITGPDGTQHIAVNGPDAPQGIAFYTGEPDETFPGVIQPDFDAASLTVTFSSPLVSGHDGASLELFTGRTGADLDGFQFDVQTATINTDSFELFAASGATYLVFTADVDGPYVDVNAPRIFLRDTSISTTAGCVVEDGDVIRIGEGWHTVGDPGEPPFLGNWAVQAVGFTCGFFKDATGRVQLRGRVKEAVASSTIIYTLPAGYRPTQSMSWLVKSNNDASTGCWVSVSSVGDVSVIGNTAGARIQTILDAISFPTF